MRKRRTQVLKLMLVEQPRVIHVHLLRILAGNTDIGAEIQVMWRG